MLTKLGLQQIWQVMQQLQSHLKTLCNRSRSHRNLSRTSVNSLASLLCCAWDSSGKRLLSKDMSDLSNVSQALYRTMRVCSRAHTLLSCWHGGVVKRPHGQGRSEALPCAEVRSTQQSQHSLGMQVLCTRQERTCTWDAAHGDEHFEHNGRRQAGSKRRTCHGDAVVRLSSCLSAVSRPRAWLGAESSHASRCRKLTVPGLEPGQVAAKRAVSAAVRPKLRCFRTWCKDSMDTSMLGPAFTAALLRSLINPACM